jgi:hypothetical protein
MACLAATQPALRPYLYCQRQKSATGQGNDSAFICAPNLFVREHQGQPYQPLGLREKD